MQFVSQSLFSALASNEVFQDLELFNATRLDSLGIVEDITLMIGEHKFVVDLVLAPLALWSTIGNGGRVPLLLTFTDGSSLTWSVGSEIRPADSWTTYFLPFPAFFPVNNRALRRVTDSLQDGCFSCVCPSYDKDSEREFWNSSTGLFCVHWYCRCDGESKSC
jgi:hypothetical protein